MSPALEKLNGLERAAFVAALGHLFEHSPWVADEAWTHRPFHDVTHLHAELCRTMRTASRARQRTLLQAHPDLAGRMAQQRKLTAASTREQASAGLDQLGEAERANFQQLNEAYRARFGFPFIICARLSAKEAILAAMRARIANPIELEFENALEEVGKIAQLRLRDLLKGG
jgi:2-oxo-4-hydroxy-4-carboxy-5-ureidoimidazoline decarboxylase